MGMFSYVAFTAACETCGDEIREWQTKDYNSLDMQTISVADVEKDGRIYGTCRSHHWNEYRIEPFVLVRSIATDQATIFMPWPTNRDEPCGKCGVSFQDHDPLHQDGIHGPWERAA